VRRGRSKDPPEGSLKVCASLSAIDPGFTDTNLRRTPNTATEDRLTTVAKLIDFDSRFLRKTS
jgi:hypothetical protein